MNLFQLIIKNYKNTRRYVPFFGTEFFSEVRLA